MKTNNTPRQDNLKPSEAAVWAGYRDVKSFLATARATGLRIIRVNSRVLLIDRLDLEEWKENMAA